MTRTREPGHPSTQSGRSSSSSRAPSSYEDDLEEREPRHGQRTGSAHEQPGERDDSERGGERGYERGYERGSERGYGGYRYGHGADGEDGDDDEDGPPSELDRDRGRRRRDDEATDFDPETDPETDLDSMDVLDVDDLNQMDGPDA